MSSLITCELNGWMDGWMDGLLGSEDAGEAEAVAVEESSDNV